MSTDRSKGNKRSISNSRAKRSSKETKDNSKKGFSILKAFLMVLFMFISGLMKLIYHVGAFAGEDNTEGWQDASDAEVSLVVVQAPEYIAAGAAHRLV